jgi:small subunit ribosomal protein S16
MSRRPKSAVRRVVPAAVGVDSELLLPLAATSIFLQILYICAFTCGAFPATSNRLDPGQHMVTIRLSRGGSKKNPFYQIVVADIRAKRDGRYIERLGFFNPIAQGGEVTLRLDRARAQYWIERGAQPTDRVKQLLKQAARDEAAAVPVAA